MSLESAAHQHPVYQLAQILPSVRERAVEAFKGDGAMQDDILYVFYDYQAAEIYRHCYSKKTRATVMDLTVVLVCLNVGLDDRASFNWRIKEVFSEEEYWDDKDFLSKTHLSFDRCIRSKGIPTWQSKARRKWRPPKTNVLNS